MMKRTRILLTPLLLAFLCFDCGGNDSISLAREDMFTLSLGKLENQLDFFFDKRSPRLFQNDIFFDNDIVYITNANGRKLMEFTPFGELTLLLYNPAYNPAPVLLKKSDPEKDAGEIVSRRAIETGFTEIGTCNVDSAKNIYVEDLAAVATETPESEAQYRKIIKRFDRLGHYIDAIGRTGKNGPPFPAIENFYLTNDDNLVVVCRITEGNIVYWFSRDCNLLYEIKFVDSYLPAPKDSDSIPVLNKIVPDYGRQKLYLMLSYFSNVKDQSTRLVSKVSFMESRIYTFDLGKEAYDESFLTIPAELGQKSDPLFSKEKQQTPVPYTFLGISTDDRFYLIKMKNKTTHELLVLDLNGATVKKMRLFIDDTNVLSFEFKISKTGILYALITENTCARVVLWRSDRAAAGSA